MLEVKLDTATPAGKLGDVLRGFGAKVPSAQALVLNRVVTRAKGLVIAAVVDQTSLGKPVIAKAVRPLRASPANPRAGLVTRGGNVSYRYFRAREVAGGVEAEVEGARKTLAGHYFRRSGKPARYVVRRLNGQVFLNRSGKWRGKITVEKSGVYIPAALVEGASRQAFLDVVGRDLPNEIDRELSKLLP